ncbi:uncharacterized protein [Chelonus insularis]|uniref:uncharacterized protein n=1 Tax=Chelonus insularis TaxID=460826 RepID=UPI00158B7AFB|nr:uncharacterized protein LOC118070082 [Chelonus insularis]
MPLQFIKSQKSTNLLVHEGIIYSRKKVNKNNISWRCATNKYCSKIIHTDCEDETGNIVGTVPVHEHAVNAAVVQMKIIKAKIKRKAETTDYKPAKILSGALRGVASPVAALMPMTTSISRLIQRTRTQHNPQFNNPTSRGELQLLDEYKKTYNNELFLLHDSGGDRNRFLVFTTVKNLNFLTKCEQWLSDGTFKSVPNIFSQLYTIHGYMSSKSVPLVYLLAPNKSKNMYINFLKVLRRSLPKYSPSRIMVDFERPFMDAIKETYPGIKISGCHFHFTQCVWRHIQLCGFQARYNKDVTFALNLKLLMALAYVPVNDVISAYEVIVSIDDRITSNNLMEGWHNSFNQRVSVSHATVNKFLDAIKDEQTKTEMLMAQIDTGFNFESKKCKAYRNYQSRLKNIVLNYDPNHKFEYLRSIAKLLCINN